MENILEIRNRALGTLGQMHNKERIALCLGYQIGDLTRAVYRLTWCEAKATLGVPGDPNPLAWYGEARIAAADTILQLRLLVNELGFDWDEIVALGEEHHKETMVEVKAGKRE